MTSKYIPALFLYCTVILQDITAQQPDTTGIVHAIAVNNKEYIARTFSQATINTPISAELPPPLFIAIQYNQKDIVTYFIKNLSADPNLRYKGITPLMAAIEYKVPDIIKPLVQYGSAINDLDSLGNTAFMLAAKHQPPAIIRFLYRNGGSLNHRNYKGYNAIDFANQSKNKKTENYLRHLYETHLPNYVDGPYIKYTEKNKIHITYLIHDSLRRKFYKQEYVKDEDTYAPNIQPPDLLTLPFIKNSFIREPSHYSNVNKILIIGDTHGQCDTLKKFLIANKIIDKNLGWAFGDGHIVFLGDMFDRGDNVTELLWLIYQLEQEAAEQGGKVHVLLGNHEIAVLSGNLYALTYKYKKLTKSLKMPYQKFYENDMVLGRWIRSKNAIITINDNIFLHAGLDPDLINQKLQTDSINTLIYNFLNVSKIDISKPPYNYILGKNGPLFYRGLVANNMLNEKDVENLLRYFNVNRIFIGHTSHPEIKTFFNGKVWGMDVPFYLPTGTPMQAVLIDNNTMYLLNTSGNPTELTNIK